MNIDGLRGSIIQSLVLWIEQNLESDLSLDIIAARAGYSKWHLQRLFKEHTGVVIGKYIRARRLSCAAKALRITRSSILDISVKYRFDSQQTFCRAFKSQFNTTPSAYRKKAGWDSNGFCFPLQAENLISFQSELAELPEMQLAGSHHYHRKNLPDWQTENRKFRREFWEKFFREVDIIPADLYAIHAPYESTADDISYAYTTAVIPSVLSADSIRRASLSPVTLPGGQYLRITIDPAMLKNLPADYNNIIHAAYSGTLAEMNLLRRRGPDIEHYKLLPAERHDEFIANGLQYVEEINYYIPVML
ncbi:effector binding domain-containing protein [Morganella morganii]|uniref:Effector binding domain-containing protein n=1 Tax=bacterium 19GA11TI05 TaxID=2920688 RepID=A0AAU6TXT8_UNCXX|nr:effector binding domain-containing protein [Morganella morganii]EMD6372385.1 effector binding domain-containing protein [Morganella morganii]MBT0420225.1 effector binding domain-containing protein [Morganella morganii subsp. morganii]MBT0515065.1 effector binding domain-containing protein [Morganella morganii subsp. morganii]MCU6354734.1 effector binding domain-containing protein [Morganella morganii]MDW7792706.1 effector binding domain-containing protein [Morganella morganii]